MSMINREALYEKACDLEAQALAYVGKIANDENKTEEWRIWSAILVERTAFKHDIFDAPEVPEPKWIPCDMQLPEKTQLCLVTQKTVVGIEVCTRCFNKRDDGGFWSGWGHTEVIAWMPYKLPEPYKGES